VIAPLRDIERVLKVFQRDALVESHDLRIGSYLGAPIHSAGHGRQLTMFESVEMPGRNLRLSRNLLQRQASMLTRVPEKFAKRLAVTIRDRVTTTVGRATGGKTSHCSSPPCNGA
jgi:hypothetical protein